MVCFTDTAINHQDCPKASAGSFKMQMSLANIQSFRFCRLLLCEIGWGPHGTTEQLRWPPSSTQL